MILRASVLAGVLSAALFGQHVPVINTGPRSAPPNAHRFGNILFPGGTPTHAERLGATIGGRPVGNGIHSRPPGPGGRQGRTVVVPYAYPVYMGDPYAYAQPPAQNITVVVPQQPTPSVIINHNYVPETAKPVLRDYTSENLPEGGVKVYEAPGPNAEAPPAKTAVQPVEDKPTIHLIALKDSTVQSAIGYWVEDGVLHYVTTAGVVNRVSLDRVDRALTNQLNRERNVEFILKD